MIGVFSINSSRTSDVHIILMENALQFENEQNLQFIFDLKGSLVNRVVLGTIKSTSTLKDLNFLKAKSVNPNIVRFDPEDREQLRSIMKKDVEFLRK